MVKLVVLCKDMAMGLCIKKIAMALNGLVMQEGYQDLVVNGVFYLNMVLQL